MILGPIKTKKSVLYNISSSNCIHTKQTTSIPNVTRLHGTTSFNCKKAYIDIPC